mgnify:CR=1 FL=1
MRPSLLPGLIAAAQRNADRGFDDLAVQRRKDIRRRLDAFDDDRFVILRHLGAHFGQFDEYHVAKLLGREAGDADRDNVVLGQKPFMFFGKFHA